jgi:hypothetical protein
MWLRPEIISGRLRHFGVAKKALERAAAKRNQKAKDALEKFAAASPKQDF